MKPELEDQRAFIAEHFFQTLSAGDGLVQTRILEQPMHPALEHLAVPVAEENPHSPFGRQHAPVAPRRWPGEFFIGLLVEGAHFDQARVHPFVEQLDRLALARPFDAVDQDDHRKALLLLQLELRFQQGFTQRRDRRLISVFVDGVTDFSGFKHWTAPSRVQQD